MKVNWYGHACFLFEGAGVVIPMHYKTPALSFNLGGVADFVRLFQPGQVRRQKALQVDEASLPSNLEVIVLDYFSG